MEHSILFNLPGIRNFASLSLIARLACCILFPGRVSFSSQAVKENNEADEQLNITYKRVLAQIADPEDKQLMVESQRAWLKFRDARVAFHARYFPGSKGGLFVSTDMMQARIAELKLLLTREARQEHEHPF